MPTPLTPEQEAHIDQLVAEMTLEEQVSLLAGADFWTTVPVERVGVPAIKVSDGPNGARGGGSLVGGVTAACFPVGISLASTWNTDLIEQIGAALAEEALSKGARALLGPTVNIHRSPLNGRNFECYSEDPHLSARAVVAYIRGLQSHGVAATVKHYVGNDSEFQRNSISSDIGERALREIYLPPFEAAVREAGTWALMSSYNKVNGTYVSENPRLLRDILKGEWGYDGVVMSDWTGTYSTAEAASAGLDLEMPGPAQLRGPKLVRAVQEGRVPAEAIADSARRLLRLMTRVGAFDDPTIPDEQAIDRPEHRALIRQAGAEGTVLLKNNGLLPLDMNARQRIALIGPNAQTAQIMGGGSAQVNAHYRVTPLEGLLAQAGPAVEIGCDTGCANYKQLPLLTGPLAVEFFNSSDLSGEVAARQEMNQAEMMWFLDVLPGVDPWKFSARLTARYTAEADGEHLFSLVSAGLSRLYLDDVLLVDNWSDWKVGDSFFGFGSDEIIGAAELQAGHTYDVRVEYAFPAPGGMFMKALRVGVTRPLGDEAIESALLAAVQADVAILFVGQNGEWDTEGRDRPHIDLVGRQNELIERVAAANPNTVVVVQSGGPVRTPWLDRVAAVLQAWYPGQECGNAIADVLTGRVNPSGRLPQTFPLRLEDNPAYVNYPGENGHVLYGEGLFVGYRYYDKKGVAPLFPFGYGLSYTTFAWDNLRLSSDTLAPGETLTVGIDVTNTGERAGADVVQLYVGDPQAALARPEKELKGFVRVILEPGERRTVSLPLDMRALAYYDDAKAAWVAEAGVFEVLVGASSADIRARAQFTLAADWVKATGR